MVSRDVVFDDEASWNWNDEPEDYKFFIFFFDDPDELVTLLLHQHHQNCRITP